MKTITINLSNAKILFDCRNKAYLTGKTREGDERIKATIQASSNDNDQMLRSIQNATDKVIIALSDYITNVDEDSFDNDWFADESDENTIVLNLPDNYNTGMAKSLATMIHEYIVNHTLRDWFTIVYKADAADYVTLTNVSIEDIKTAAAKRKAPTRY